MNKKHRNYNNTPEIPLGGLLDKPAPLFTLEWWQYGAALGYIVPVVAVLAFDYTGTLLLIIGLHSEPREKPLTLVRVRDSGSPDKATILEHLFDIQAPLGYNSL